MAIVNSEAKCNNCNHNCHCEDIVCNHPIGVGLSDKWQPCGCGVCECDKEQIKYPDWG